MSPNRIGWMSLARGGEGVAAPSAGMHSGAIRKALLVLPGQSKLITLCEISTYVDRTDKGANTGNVPHAIYKSRPRLNAGVQTVRQRVSTAREFSREPDQSVQS